MVDSPESTLYMLETFSGGPVWRDVQRLLKARIALNAQDFEIGQIPIEEVRRLQGSTAEMRSMLRLPEMLKEAIELYLKEEKEKDVRNTRQV